jgi:AAA family ATP:ADP antiporter
MLQVAAALLTAHLLLYLTVRRRRTQQRDTAAASGKANGFALVVQSPYLRLIALLLVLLNVVNTTGEYILANLVTEAAAGIPAGAARQAYIGEFYGSYFLWVNIVSVTVQALIVSRVVKLVGLSGALLALPIVALGAYGLIATGMGLAMVRWMKTGENAADYSFMNTAKQMLWLPTTKEEKYKGKQAIDTFFVRFGDMLAAGVVFVGTEIVALSSRTFAVANLVIIACALLVALLVLREYKRLTTEEAGRLQPAVAPS